MKLFKVLKNGKSFHGGNFTWSIPHDNQPGDWHEVDGAIALCVRGFHVTHDPGKWWADGCTVYSAEVDHVLAIPERDKERSAEKSKIVVGKIRLFEVVPMIKIDGGKWQVQYDENKSSGWSDPKKVVR